MFDIKAAARDLDNLLHEIVVKQGIFVQISKDLIRYKNYMLIRNDDKDWVVLTVVDGKKKHISTVCLKVSAFAICKLHEKRKLSRIQEVESQDIVFKKHYIDSLFYRKTAETSQNEVSRENAQWRYEIAASEARAAKKKIDSIFYASIV
jgi:hypothetical protein